MLLSKCAGVLFCFFFQMSIKNITVLVLEEIFLLWSYYFNSAHITHTDINGSYAYMLTVKSSMCSNPSFCLIVIMLCALSISEDKKPQIDILFFNVVVKISVTYCGKRHVNVLKTCVYHP